MPRASIHTLLLALTMLLPRHAMAQAATAPASSTPAITRADLAHAYLRIDRAIEEHPPTGESCAEINRVFDRATMKFFANQFGPAVAELNAMYASMLADDATKANIERWGDLVATASPAIYPLDEHPAASVRIRGDRVSHKGSDAQSEPRLRIVDVHGNVVGEAAASIDAARVEQIDVTLPIQLNERASPGVCSIVVVDGDNPPMIIGRWTLVASRLEPVRRSNAKALDRITKEGQIRPQSIACCIARNRLLSDVPSPTSSAQFLGDPAQLQAEVAVEIAQLERGVDPYLQRNGDAWRALAVGSSEVPFRVFAPPARDRHAASPLVIALHGLGGDENMFMDAYGAGVIKRLAAEKGFIVVSPLTYPIAGDAALLDALIDETATCYTIDRDRIYLIGHSLGAGAAMGLAMARKDRIAAACCIAGGGVSRAKGAPPMLIIAADLDALAGAGAAVRGAKEAEKARANGAAIEYRIMKDWGHTLCVGPALPDAIDWLLAHSRAKPAD